MGRRRSAWLGLAGWLVASCTYTSFPAESTAAACFNTEDDDHDGRMNCDDPDCWHLAYCEPGLDGDMPPLAPLNPPVEMMPDDPLVPPVDNQSMTDGSTPIDMPMTDARVPPDAPEDAGLDADLPVVCSKYCPEGSCNDDGSCRMPLVFGDFEVESIGLAAPRMRDSMCFDLRFGCTLVADKTCCAPDPIVTIYVGEAKAGFVAPIADSEAPVWEGVDMQISLREGDEVTFKVEDEDTLLVGDVIPSDIPLEMFRCSTLVTAAMIEAGRLGCAPMGDFRPFGEYYVGASISPRGGEGGGEDEDDQGDMP